VKLLLDTHAWLWFYLGDAQLSVLVRSQIADPANTILISPASYWELAIKISLGKYVLDEPFDQFIQDALIDSGFTVLPIEPRHATELAKLPFSSGHKDPFDRLLIAQAMVEQIPIVSGDEALDAYGVIRIW
jgi:PIN domain nuclease of toxin-antitoxin system